MESDAAMAKKLEELRYLGVCIALDDFGRGHSSLSRLQDFPISTIKIDRLFVEQICSDRRQILDAIVALAHELNLRVIAEGVETWRQLRYLRERGPALAQGFFFSEALPEEKAFQFLTAKRSWNNDPAPESMEPHVSRET